MKTLVIHSLGLTFLALLGQAAVPTAANALTFTPGALDGEFAVTPSGTAAYTIPVKVPAGVGGMAPKLALQYDSERVKGVLGKGWWISGFSEISRCTTTYAAFGYQRSTPSFGIETSEDAYCFEGQFLRHVNAGASTNGSSGAEYRLEIDNFSRIRVVDHKTMVVRDNNGFNELKSIGPKTFKVEEKGGVTHYYGETPESRIEAPDAAGRVMAWQLSRSVDTYGNEIRYRDYRDPNTGERLPSAIVYTSNPAQGLAANRVVVFRYESRSVDKSVLYRYGIRGGIYHRLLQLETYVDADVGNPARVYGLNPTISGRLVRRYDFAYTRGEGGRTLLLDWVRECGGEGTCYPATAFSYSRDVNLSVFRDDAPAGMKATAELITDQADGCFSGSFPGDFDGDGHLEVVFYKENYDAEGAACERRGGGDYRTLFDFPGPKANQGPFINELSIDDTDLLTGDFDGDGTTDLLFSRVDRTTAGDSTLFVSDPAGAYGFGDSRFSHQPGALKAVGNLPVTSPHVVDLNGDGLSDLFFEHKIAAPAPDPTCYDLDGCLPSGSEPEPTEHLRDHFYVMLRKSPTEFDAPLKITIPQAVDIGGVDYQSGDFNGDNLADMLVYRRSSGFGPAVSYILMSRKAYYAAGVPRVEYSLVTAPFSQAYSFRNYIGDFNGDGYDDVFGFTTNTQGDTGVWIGDGRGNFTFTADAMDAPILGYNDRDEIRPYIVDFDRNGTDDILIVNHAAGSANDGNNNNQLFLSDGLGQFKLVAAPFLPSQGLDGGTSLAFGDFAGLGAIDVFAHRAGSKAVSGGNGVMFWLSDLYNAGPVLKLYEITDGLGRVTKVNYRDPTNPQFYQKHKNAVYPTADIVPPYPVVVSHGEGSKVPVYETSSDGTTSTTTLVEYRYENLKTTSYRYEGAKIDLKGRGSLGFRKTTTTDFGPVTNETILTHRQEFPFIGVLAQSEQKQNGIVVGQRATHVSEHFPVSALGELVRYPYVSAQLESAFDPVSGKLLSKTGKTSRNLDDYGNIGELIVETVDHTTPTPTTSRTTTQAHFENRVSSEKWHLGRMTCSAVKSEVIGADIRGGDFNERAIRRSAFTYYDQTGVLKDEITDAPPAGSACNIYDPAHTPQPATITHHYDGFGNEIRTGLSMAGSTDSRESRLEFIDGTGPGSVVPHIKSTDAEGYASVKHVDIAHGGEVYSLDIDGNVTRNEYDDLGRLQRVLHPNGTATTTKLRTSTLTDCKGWTGKPAGSFDGAVYVVETSHTLGRTSRECFDRYGNKLLTGTLDIKGKELYQFFEYDNFVRPIGESVPGGRPASFAAIQWSTRQTYDTSNRLASTNYANGLRLEQTYRDYTTTVTRKGVENGSTVSRTAVFQRDGNGKTIAIVDPAGNTTRFQYGPFETLRFIRDPAGNLISYKYDPFGRKVFADDPELGTLSFEYFPNGELKSATDIGGRRSVNSYDRLGRTVRIQEYQTPLGGNSNGTLLREVVYEFYPASSGKSAGKLKLERTAGFEKSYTYEPQFGNLEKETQRIEGNEALFTTSYTYDAYGRLDRTVYPEGGLTLENKLNQYSDVVTVNELRPESATNQALRPHKIWSIEDTDGQGRVNYFSYGNGTSTRLEFQTGPNYLNRVRAGKNGGSELIDIKTTFSPFGNLTSRENHNIRVAEKSFSETFSYDNLSRLTEAKRPDETTTYRYDAIGNLTYRSDLGTLVYDSVNRRGQKMPHAVSEVIPEVSIPDIDGDGKVAQTDYDLLFEGILRNSPQAENADCYRDGKIDVVDSVCVANLLSGNANERLHSHQGSYRYDLFGNMIEGAGRTISYTPFHKPAQITTLNDSEAVKVSFTYDTGNARIKKTTLVGDGDKQREYTTFYVGGLFDKTIKPDGTVERNYYVRGPQGLALVKTITGSQAVYEYQHEDHLGSVVAKSDSAGVLVPNSKKHFGPFGRPYAVANDTLSVPVTPDFTTTPTYGFTGHEGVPEIGLVNMNARMYDPVLGRFLSADPTIPDLGDPQSLNRYSYVRNNPLGYVDPTGYGRLSTSDIRMIYNIVKAVMAIAVASECPSCSAAIFGTWGAVEAYSETGDGRLAALVVAQAWLTQGANLDMNEVVAVLGNLAVSVVISNITGGSWERTVLQAGFDAATGSVGQDLSDPTLRFIVGALIGGTSEAIGGGKFANGAVSGGFAMAMRPNKTGKDIGSDQKFDWDHAPEWMRNQRRGPMLASANGDALGVPAISYDAELEKLADVLTNVNDRFGSCLGNAAMFPTNAIGALSAADAALTYGGALLSKERAVTYVRSSVALASSTALTAVSGAVSLSKIQNCHETYRPIARTLRALQRATISEALANLPRTLDSVFYRPTAEFSMSPIEHLKWRARKSYLKRNLPIPPSLRPRQIDEQ